MPTVIITGGTGLIGRRLSELLVAKNYEVIVFSHSKQKINACAGVVIKQWNVDTGEIDTDAIAKADFIIHLAGANVADKRWTAKRKQEIIDSRTKSSALLIKALQQTPNRVTVVVSASAIGWYGADSVKSREQGFSENEPPAAGFLGQTCRLWEESIEPVTALNKRLVKFRTGIVLSNQGGALPQFIKPLKFGIATILGNGNQIISWIHIEDICNMYLHALENNNLFGSYNSVAPLPVTNKNLVLQLAKVMRGNTFLKIPVPSYALRLVLGQMSEEVLKSATVSSKKIEQTGFRFQYPELQSAMKQLIKK